MLMKGLAYNKDLQEDKESLFDAVKTVIACLEAMTILLREGFLPHSLAEAALKTIPMLQMSRTIWQRGVPREAYNLVGKVKLAAGKLLLDLNLQEWKALHPAFEADIYQAISPRQVVAAQQLRRHRLNRYALAFVAHSQMQAT